MPESLLLGVRNSIILFFPNSLFPNGRLARHFERTALWCRNAIRIQESGDVLLRCPRWLACCRVVIDADLGGGAAATHSTSAAATCASCRASLRLGERRRRHHVR